MVYSFWFWFLGGVVSGTVLFWRYGCLLRYGSVEFLLCCCEWNLELCMSSIVGPRFKGVVGELRGWDCVVSLVGFCCPLRLWGRG